MSVKYPCTPYLLLHVLTLITAEVVLVSSVEQEGRAAACPGELVIFTFTVAQGFSLNWASTVFTCDNSPSPTFVLTASTSVGDTVNCGSFQANATNVSLVGAGRGNISSTLTPFAPTPAGTVVTCSDPLVSQLPPQQSRPYPNVTGNYDYKLVCGCILYYYAYFSMCTLSRSSISPQNPTPLFTMVLTISLL